MIYLRQSYDIVDWLTGAFDDHHLASVREIIQLSARGGAWRACGAQFFHSPYQIDSNGEKTR
jgi:hypothetical protein